MIRAFCGDLDLMITKDTRVPMFCLSWKWRNRSSVKKTEGTYEEGTEAFIPEEKVAILRRHLVDKVPVSELCEELGLRPTVFYRWQKELFENGAAAFESQERPQRQVDEKQKRIEFLEKKVQTKDEVLAELMAEHIALKKVLGNMEKLMRKNTRPIAYRTTVNTFQKARLSGIPTPTQHP